MTSRGSWLQADSLGRIADYLNCSTDYLLGRTAVSTTTSGEITADEQTLLSYFNSLNDEGKEKTLERLEEMASLDRYKKGSQSDVAEEA